MNKLFYKGELRQYQPELAGEELNHIQSLLTAGRRKPAHIQVREELLRSIYLEIREPNDMDFFQAKGGKEHPKRYDLYDSIDREIVRQFEREWNEWLEIMPYEKQTFQFFLWHKRASVYRGEPHIDQKGEPGKLRYGIHQEFVFNPNLFAEYQKKWSAYNELGYLRERAKRNQDKQFDELRQDKKELTETLFEWQ